MAFRGDAQYDISDDGFLRKLRVGARYADRKQTVRTNDYNNWGAVSDTWTGGGPTFFSRLTAADQAAFTYNNFFRGQAVQPPSATYIPNSVLENHVALEDLLRRATALGGGNYRPLEDRGTNLIKGYFLPGEIYKNRERTYSAYARLDFGTQSFSNGMRLSGNIGLRFVHTKDDSIGSLTLPQRNSVLPTDNPPAGTPPRYTTVVGYCAFSLAQQQANPNPSFVLPAICTVSPAQQDAAVAFANGASFADVASQSFNKYLPSLNLQARPDAQAADAVCRLEGDLASEFRQSARLYRCQPLGLEFDGQFQLQAPRRKIPISSRSTRPNSISPQNGISRRSAR